MKKTLVCLLALLLCMACMGVASAEKPGDQVSVPITLNNTNAAYVKISVSYDKSIFDLVSFTCNGQKNGTTFNMSSLSGVPSGQCATITLKIKDSAPAGTYTISASVKEAWTANESAATASASGGKVTVVLPATPTVKPADPTPTVKPADPTVKPADPTVKPADPTVKPADPTVKPADPTPTVKPTEKPAPNRRYYNMTVSSIGPRFKDISELTDKWHMFSVVDLSKDGVQTLDLIAGDVHKIGTVTLTVANGTVTVDYDLNAYPITEKAKFFTFFNDLKAIETIDTKELEGYEFGEAITLGEDTNLILYVRMDVVYASDAKNVKKFYENSEEYTKLVEDMLKLMVFAE